MTARIVTDGRDDLADFFSKSGILSWKRLPLYPFLAFLVEGDTVTVRVIIKAAELLTLPDETPVMVQWPGEWRSDFMRLTVGDYRRALKASAP